MELLLLVLVLTIPAAFLRAPLFYGVFGLLLPLPIVARLVYTVLPYHWVAYLVGLLLLIAVGAVLVGVRKPTVEHLEKEVTPVAFFCICFVGLYRLVLRWPDFFAMGERLRDYAVLSSLLKDPYVPSEPWMSGETISYYLHWYRFGHLLATLLSLEAWEVYHILSAFPLALLFTTLFFLFTRFASFSILPSLVGAALISFGSNIQGIIHYYNSDDGWWGPSRVIKGAINEFPVWSFILGDVHPHYLNLPLPLFLLGLVPLIALSERGRGEKFLYFLALLIVAPLWLYNANAWDAPFWIETAVIIISAMGALHWRGWSSLPMLKSRLFTLSLLVIALCASLVLSSRNIQTDPGTAAFVRRPIELSSMTEIALHWGAPLGLIALSMFLLMPRHLLAGALLGMGLAAFADPALPFLITLLVLVILRLQYEVQHREISPQHLFFEGCGVAALGLIILPEVVFLNDSYGGESERMNTIFKAYSYSWPLLHLYALWLLARAWRERNLEQVRFVPTPLAYAVALIFFCGFAYRVADKLRPTTGRGLAEAEGLKGYDVRYPGAANAIRALRASPPGVVLESQGDPYSDTTHVATLAGQSSYLGWINHLQLLLPRDVHPRITHRSEITKKIYTELACEEKRELLKKEDISYVVFGPLEAERFGVEKLEQFECLTPLVREGTYSIFKP